jgi:uncharacterized protein involved in exopolysaccharide biosynthesis
MSSVRPVPDLEAEEAEVDLGRYVRQLLLRWWLLVVGLVVGAVVGYLTTLTGAQYYRAQAVVYLGQPLGAITSNPVAALNTNPASAQAILTSDSVVRRVAARTGLSSGRIRSGTSVNAVAGSAALKVGQTPLIQVTMKGPEPAKVQLAANTLANVLVSKLSAPARAKIALFETQRDSDLASIKTVSEALTAPDLSTTDKLLLQLRLQAFQSDLTQVTEQLAQARDIEAPSVVTPATSVKTSVRSHRNSTLVGALIGLLLGAAAALAWEPIQRARSRS